MSKSTWACVPCRKLFLRKKSLGSVECPACRGPCEKAHWSARIPPPKQTKDWDEFWAMHTAIKTFEEDVARLQSEDAKPGPQTTSSEPAIHVTYLAEICAPLIKTLTHSATVPVNQLAGHAANVDFWISEARHCLAAIDGYPERFVRLRACQAEYEKQHEIVDIGPPLRQSLKDSARQELRREVCQAIERFLARCHRNSLISDEFLNASLRSLRTN